MPTSICRLDLDAIREYIALKTAWTPPTGGSGNCSMPLTPSGGLPLLGHRREDLTSFPILFWPVGAYLIIYRAERHPVEIVAVTQGSRDIPAFLRRRLRH